MKKRTTITTAKKKKTPSLKKVCRTVIKHEGINSRTGKLKKGYKYHNGKIVKVEPAPKKKAAPARKKSTATKRKVAKKK